MIEPTNDNLRSRIATKPLARWLISAAHEETKLTYGNVQNRLETQCHFGNIGRPTRTGVVAGAMQDEILDFNPKAPLLNVLLVRQDTERPGAGVRGYLARRFPYEHWLHEDDPRERYPENWNNICDQAVSEVYDYPYWNDLYGDIYENDYVIDLNDEPDPVGA